MDVLNLFFRAPGTGVAEPDVGGQKVLLIKQDHAVAKSMMKVIPEKVTEQLGLLRVIDKSKAGEIVRNIFIELRDNIGFRGGRLTFMRSSSQGNHRKKRDHTTQKMQFIIPISHNDAAPVVVIGLFGYSIDS
ncbi:MAG TPA: hypothetical protein DIU00_18880 [Phycisphaerales bacterium]|nr:hypothetical protein [Phycisphaerales bacterium]